MRSTSSTEKSQLAQLHRKVLGKCVGADCQATPPTRRQASNEVKWTAEIPTVPGAANGEAVDVDRLAASQRLHGDGAGAVGELRRQNQLPVGGAGGLEVDFADQGAVDVDADDPTARALGRDDPDPVQLRAGSGQRGVQRLRRSDAAVPERRPVVRVQPQLAARARSRASGSGAPAHVKVSAPACLIIQRLRDRAPTGRRLGG
jgi:hypothetical protein